jgi:NADH dehydrogenase/NADH:ubiquinone oxidoreductase subunit G
MINLVNFTVNNLGYNSPVGLLLIDALARNNIEVPRLCYHEELSIAGNCRLCLVEVKGSFKPAACCALNINQSMQLFTNTKMVKLARENSLEFMLINHPLDCPVCDQGGECDLQDQSYVFGGDRGRFYEEKRAVEDEFISPVIKVILTRCIHCTRCVRFFEEVSGTPFLGMINRGCNMQISTFTKSNIIDFELSGNAIDLCPVGALTFKASAFKGRA